MEDNLYLFAAIGCWLLAGGVLSLGMLDLLYRFKARHAWYDAAIQHEKELFQVLKGGHK